MVMGEKIFYITAYTATTLDEKGRWFRAAFTFIIVILIYETHKQHLV